MTVAEPITRAPATDAPDVAALLAWGTNCLTPSPSPRLDATVLLGHALGATRTWLMTWPEHIPGVTAHERYRALVRQRAAGRPVAQLTGEREFWSLPLRVTADTLTPRADTETLVDAALAVAPASTHVLDLGTGTGALALALASEWPGACVDAVESSAAAAALARVNARRLGLAARVRVLEGDWYAPVAERRYPLIVSNPPYIDAREPEPWQADAAWEPRHALIAAERGLAALRAIIAGAPEHLDDGGHLLLEHGWRQGAVVRKMLRQCGFQAVTTQPDLAGRPRVSAGRWLS